MVTAEDSAHLVEYERIGTAAETRQLDHVQTCVGGATYAVRRLEDTIRIRPLTDGVYLLEHPFVACRHVLRQYVDTHVGDDIGDAVLDERVDMIRPCRQQNDHASFPLRGVQHLVIAFLQCVQIILLRGDGSRDCLLCGLVVHPERGKVFG